MEKVKLYFRNWKMVEQMIYWIIWLVIILLPLFFWDFGNYYERRRIVWGWLRLLPLLVIFIVHNSILLPQYLQKGKQKSYLLLTVFLVLGVNYLIAFNEPIRNYLYELFMGPEFGPGYEPPGGRGRGGPGHGSWAKHYRKFKNPELFLFTYNVVISILLVAFNASVNFTTTWLKKEQDRKEIDKEGMRSQLTALQQQVSPHFFMNTLNNIHALIDYDKENAKESVLRLSELMRYLLYDVGHEQTSLKKEIEFLHSYIDLMRLRIFENVKMDIHFPSVDEGITIPPFLFIPFVENAFKYGVLPKGESYISTTIEVINNQLHFNCKNSRGQEEPSENKHSGLGISNTKKRLELLYGHNFTLNIFERESEFEVDLVIPLHE